MKKTIIFVFSGTGNTLRVANYFKEAFENREISTDIIQISRNEKMPDVSEYDCIGLGYPIHAFNTPAIFYDYIKKLPDSQQNKKCFVFKTSGEPFKINNSSSEKLFRLLKKKGYVPSNEIHILMPYNIIFRYPEGVAAQMDYYAHQMAKKETDCILKGVKTKIKHGIFSQFASFVFRIEQPAAKFNGKFYKANNEKCILCNRCVLNCPEKNINIKDGTITFGKKCSLCMRCAMNCPVDAINIGLLNKWKVNPPYDFEKLKTQNTPFIIDKNTKGYFKNFLNYFEKAKNYIDENITEQ